MALAGGTVALAASPALAAPPDVQITSLSATNVDAGGRTTMRYTVRNPSQDEPASVRVNVSGMDCAGDCSPSVTLQPGGSQDFTANLTAGPVDDGKTKTVKVQVKATANGESGTASQNVTVRGPDKPAQVRQISGRVRDPDGKAISGAQVLMKDSGNHQYSTTTNGDGRFVFTSSDGKPITPGTISIGAIKDDFNPASTNVQAGANKTVNVTLTLKPIAAASPSATPSETASPTPSATEEATEEATDEATEEASNPATDPAANADDSGSGSMLFIIIGGLLVAAGVGAIVLVLMRRREAGGDDPGADDPDGANVPGAAPYGGMADATRVGAPMGGSNANDATMVATLGPGSLSDAQTMLHQAVPPIPADDEFPDPYGVPAGQQWSPPPGAASAAATAAAASTPYGGGTYGGGAQPYGASEERAYGDRGYGGERERFDEPTGMYRPEQDGYPEPDYDRGGYRGAEPGGHDGYGRPTDYPPAGSGRARPEPADGGPYASGGYGHEPDRAADRGGYGSWDAPADGIDSGNAYGAPSGGNGYGDGQYGGGTDDPRGGNPYGGGTQQYGGGRYGGDPRGGGTYDGTQQYGGTAPQQYGGNQYGGDPRGGQYDDGQYGGGTQQYGGGAAPQQYGGSQYGGDPRGGQYDEGRHSGDYGSARPGGAYGNGPSSGGGYGAGGADPRGGYGSPAGGGDGNYAGGSGQYGRDDRGGYGRPDDYRGGDYRGGYDQGGNAYDDRGGYYGGEQGGGRHGEPPRQPRESTHPGQRRPLDWLDD
ncbi:carboxypeptidase-like regulatory domain-containing protein [Mangrovihabitans endophyticus]|uniref:carboxypeptidase-like regulatory domain-containing protein n=1 Tax=Mangrovihabitans endophyticus TaxID=1751298 RepID=UPI00166E710D|nr:carboxypeptidase-like regulatory domain-containing protein [Mangrovihabitans endophyticus]